MQKLMLRCVILKEYDNVVQLDKHVIWQPSENMKK